MADNPVALTTRCSCMAALASAKRTCCAVGNGIIARKPNAKVVYMHSERFVQDMVKALQNNAIEEFKRTTVRWTRC